MAKITIFLAVTADTEHFRPDDGRFLTRRVSPVWQLEPGLVWLTQCSTICNGQRDGFLIHEITNQMDSVPGPPK